MKGDFSRQTFHSERHFTAVRMQQGRVLQDADINEEHDILGHRLDLSFRDVIGDAAAPVDPDSFKVAIAANKITVSAGRYYVGGRLLENDAVVTLPAQPHLSGGYCVLDTGNPAFDVAALAAGDYAVILDSWVRHVTALEMPELIEPALGGVTTASRLQSVWQLKLMKIPTNTACGGVKGTPAWLANAAPVTALMEAGTDTPPPAPDKCDLSPSGGYQGLENDLYRVEIHTPGTGGSATYKWSIDNASFASLATSWDNGNTLTIASAPGDLTRGFQIGDTVELIDVATELRELPGKMLVIGDIVGETITFSTPHGLGAAASGATAEARRLRVRRWIGPLTIPNANGWQPLGTDGVRIRFEKSAAYKTGQDWAFIARTATNAVEWPAVKLPPENPPHLLTPLARIRVDGAGNITLLGDCRILFPPLSAMISLLYVGGDGQEAVRNEAGNPAALALAEPISVAVMRGKLPVAGAPVKFSIAAGPGGKLNGAASPVTVLTGADGVASCAWALDPGVEDLSQRVEARMLDDGGTGFGNPVRFAARAFELRAMALAGGDTQTQVIPDGAATVELAEPLRVLVTRANRPLVNAPVRFSVVGGTGTVRAVGGGAGAATVDIQTDANGFAECLWTLVPGDPPSHVVAKLMKNAATPWGAPDIRFSGSLIDLPRGGCCVTVGKGGDFETLDEAMETLLADDEINDICICLTAGDHVLTKNIVIYQRDGLNLMIHGCGPATRLHIGDRHFYLYQMGAFELADLELIAGKGSIVALAMPSATLRRVTASGERYIFASQQCTTVTIEDCDLSHVDPNDVKGAERGIKTKRKKVNEAKLAGNLEKSVFLDLKVLEPSKFIGGPTALVQAKDLILFADFDSDVRILRNRINGAINFGGGEPGNLNYATYLADLQDDKHPITLPLGNAGLLTILDNVLWEVRVTDTLAVKVGLDERPPKGIALLNVPVLTRFERNRVLSTRSVLPGQFVSVVGNQFVLGGDELLVIAPLAQREKEVVKIFGNLGLPGSKILSTSPADKGLNMPLAVWD
ncbi:DUF6519 domain-containing protein [Sphingomonas sp. LB-2]|uniref:DUF6519 domain-containing protein n=1 Tax=Sphingomonas caeni TaxID=2984949 RepID=UPI00222E45E6|nr:DUF6519 domain-containing protein [Sphingomonas caeni]MCW3846490.1 DUF6519 domain-containing protein [Sphingomonas caeni]